MLLLVQLWLGHLQQQSQQQQQQPQLQHAVSQGNTPGASLQQRLQQQQ
jgi:hypothetical protein